MKYDHVQKLFKSDPILFQPWEIADEWLDDWVLTSTEDIESLFKDEKNSNYNEVFFDYSTSDAHPQINEITIPEAIENFYRVAKWPATPDCLPPPDCLGFYLSFHHSPDRYGIYILEEGINSLSTYFFQEAKGSIPSFSCQKAATYFIYYHETFHHKVEMMATRLELIARKPTYIEPVRTMFEEGKKGEYWFEEALANVNAYHQCIKKLKKELNVEQLDTLKHALLNYIKRQPHGYRDAAKMINISGSPEKNPDLMKNIFYEFIHERLMPEAKGYYSDVWDFGYFDYPLNKINGKVNFLLPKNSPLSKTISLNGRLLSSKSVIKKLIKQFNIQKVREGKGSHSIWCSSDGSKATIPKNNDLPVGTLNKILKDLKINMNVNDFLKI